MRNPYTEDLLCVLLSWVETYPGYWTAALCRLLNGLTAPWQELPPPTPDWDQDYHPPTVELQAHTYAQVVYCGLCRDYANPRKRQRAAALPAPLPGFSRGAYQLHPPCAAWRLKTVQAMLYRLAAATMLHAARAQIPDPRNARGWDYATRWYPAG